jgi:hypothetical protein
MIHASVLSEHHVVFASLPFEILTLSFHRFFTTQHADLYGARIGERLKFVEMNVFGPVDSTTRNGIANTSAQGQAIFELEVEKGQLHISSSSSPHRFLLVTYVYHFALWHHRYVQRIRNTAWSLCCIYRRPVSNYFASCLFLKF